MCVTYNLNQTAEIDPKECDNMKLSRFGAVFHHYIRRVTAVPASTFDSPRVNPTEKSPEESSYRRNHGRVIVSVSAKNKAT